MSEKCIERAGTAGMRVLRLASGGDEDACEEYIADEEG